MNDLTDQQLLSDYAGHRTEAAFAELVRRHVDLVYSAALRMVCDPHLAQDVTQAAFVALARNASQLADRAVLSGWLHRTAQNIAAQTVRTDVRRRAREQEAAAMNEFSATAPTAAWENIAPQLDLVLTELSEADRDALLLRYFERKSAREMAQRLGISDEAAQKRVNRAVERLRELFAKRGVTVGASGLAMVLSANAIQAAPAGLAITIATASSLAGASITATATVTTIKTIAMTTLQKTLITAVITAAVGSGIYEAHQATTLQTQVQTLRQQQAPLTEHVRQLEQEHAETAQQLTALREENDRLNHSTDELLRLRGEVTQLRHNQITPAILADSSPAITAPPVNNGTTSEEFGRALGQAVVRGDPAAMQNVQNLSKAEHDNFSTNSVGLDDTQRGDLDRQTFAPLHAAFEVIAEAAAKGSQTAMNAVIQSLQTPELQGMGVQSLGTMAGGGNNDALAALLNYNQYGLLLSGAVGALKPAADNGNQKAIEFLAAVAQDPSQSALSYMVADGLTKAAAAGNSQAIAALITLSGDNDSGVKRAALSGLRQAAVNQNPQAANALHSMGLGW